MWAFQGMPFVNVTSKFQVVGRYTFIESDAPNGVRLATYESRIVPAGATSTTSSISARTTTSTATG